MDGILVKAHAKLHERNFSASFIADEAIAVATESVYAIFNFSNTEKYIYNRLRQKQGKPTWSRTLSRIPFNHILYTNAMQVLFEYNHAI